MSLIEVRQVEGKGRGVFALRPIRANDLIERAPVLIIPREQAGFVEETDLQYYWYDWKKDEQSASLVLGFGSLYNHSYRPNARYVRHFQDEAMEYIAVRDIAAGEEICINYNGVVDDESAVWFDVLP